MKRLLAFVLTLILAVSSFGLNALAEEDSVDSSVSVIAPKKVELFDEFTVLVVLKNIYEHELSDIVTSIQYDSSKIEYVSQKLPSVQNGEKIESFPRKSGTIEVIIEGGTSVSAIAKDAEYTLEYTFKAINTGDFKITLDDTVFAAIVNGYFKENTADKYEVNINVPYPALISGASLTLGTGIKLVFSALIPEKFEGAEVCFTQDCVTEQEEAILAKGKNTGLSGKYIDKLLPVYDFAKSVHPSRLGDQVYAQVMYNGIALSEKKNYSVIDYCNRAFEKGKELFPTFSDEQINAFNTLLSDLLVYGDSAQIYSNYNTSNLVTGLVNSNFELTPSTFKGITSTDLSVTQGEITDPTLSSVTLLLGSNFRMSFKISATDISGVKAKVRFVKDGVHYFYYADSSHFVPTETKGVYTLEVKPDATGVDSVYEVIIYDKDGNRGKSATYSVKSYVGAIQNDTTILGEISRKLYNYGKSLESYSSLTK